MTVERLVSRVLLWGGVAGIALMVAGLAAYAMRAGIHGEAWNPAQVVQAPPSGPAVGVFTSIPQIARRLRQWPVDPLAVSAAGVLVLLATPVAAVAAAIPAFLRAHERRYAAIAAILAGVLVASLLAGRG